MKKKKIIALIDCDSFFVSCERVFTPELEREPLCVVSGIRGCVISRSKEAKIIGVPMGIPLFQAVEQFPNCIYLNANHLLYTKISKQIMEELKNFSPNVEIYSIDEAFVDFTGLNKVYKMNYYDLAQYLQKRIREKIGIPVSIGLSSTKTLAKLASDKAKNTNDRVLLLGERKSEKFLKSVKIGEVWGIGKKISRKLEGHAILTPYDYIKKDKNWIKKTLGKNGLSVYYELKGIQIASIENNQEYPKSISSSKSFNSFTSDLNFIKNELAIHIHDVCIRLRKIKSKCKTISLFLKTKDFKILYEKRVLNKSTDFEFDISKEAIRILEKLYMENILYRSVGISIEDFEMISESNQLQLFQNKEKDCSLLGVSIDKLEKKYGKNIVQTGFIGKNIPYRQGFLTNPKDIECD